MTERTRAWSAKSSRVAGCFGASARDNRKGHSKEDGSASRVRPQMDTHTHTHTTGTHVRQSKRYRVPSTTVLAAASSSASATSRALSSNFFCSAMHAPPTVISLRTGRAPECLQRSFGARVETCWRAAREPQSRCATPACRVEDRVHVSTQTSTQVHAEAAGLLLLRCGSCSGTHGEFGFSLGHGTRHRMLTVRSSFLSPY